MSVPMDERYEILVSRFGSGNVQRQYRDEQRYPFYCDFYRSAIRTWTQRDQLKRATAEQQGLDYVVLWDGSKAMSDSVAWSSMGCPSAQDWREQNSRDEALWDEYWYRASEDRFYPGFSEEGLSGPI